MHSAPGVGRNWERGVHLDLSNVVSNVDGTDEDGNPTSQVSVQKVRRR